jgi:hypothetical protein
MAEVAMAMEEVVMAEMPVAVSVGNTAHQQQWAVPVNPSDYQQWAVPVPDCPGHQIVHACGHGCRWLVRSQSPQAAIRFAASSRWKTANRGGWRGAVNLARGGVTYWVPGSVVLVNA